MITTEKLTTTDVKKINKNRIFRLIHYANRISRQEIAESLQLSLPTVNQNLKILTEQNLIEYVGSFESTGGRKAQVITVNGVSKHAVSVNLSAQGIKVSLVDLKGEVVCSVAKTMQFSESAEYADAIESLVNDVVVRNNVERDEVLGVGITIPGIFSEDGSMVLTAPTMGIKNYSVNNITNAISYKSIMMNDARANAYAEYWQSRVDKEDESLKIYVMLNTGVGGAYIDRENIRIGRHNRCGEFGHMTIHPGGRKCNCGKKGCFEAYVSADRLSTDLGITLDEFFAQLKVGNDDFDMIFREYLDNLTTGINNLYIIYDDDIILGGPVSRYLHEYEDTIKAMLSEKCSFDTDASYISFAKCTPEQASTGAALTFLGDFISSI